MEETTQYPEELSVDDLNELLAERNQVAEMYRAETLRLRRLRDAEVAQQSAQAKLAAMSDDERQALAQIIAPTGITSGEQSGASE